MQPSSNTQLGNHRFRVGDRVRLRKYARQIENGPTGTIRELQDTIPLVEWDKGASSTYNPYDLVYAFEPGDKVQLRADIQQVGLVKAIGGGLRNEGQLVISWKGGSQNMIYRPTTEGIEPYREPNPICGKRDCIASEPHRHIESDADICATCDGQGCPVCRPEPRGFEKLVPIGPPTPAPASVGRQPLATDLAVIAREIAAENECITNLVNAAYHMLDEVALPKNLRSERSIVERRDELHDALKPLSDYRTNQMRGT